MVTRIQDRRGSAAQWLSANPVLLSGEPGFETDTGFRKTGDGATAWASLAYDAVGRDLSGTYGALVGANFTGHVLFKSGRPWVDPLAFGADPSGVADSAAAFRSAAAVCQSLNVPMVISPGTYAMLTLDPGGSQVFVPLTEGISIRALLPGTVTLKLGSAITSWIAVFGSPYAAGAVDLSGLDVQHLRFDGNSIANPYPAGSPLRYAVVAYMGSGLNVSNNTFTDWEGRNLVCLNGLYFGMSDVTVNGNRGVALGGPVYHDHSSLYADANGIEMAFNTMRAKIIGAGIPSNCGGPYELHGSAINCHDNKAWNFASSTQLCSPTVGAPTGPAQGYRFANNQFYNVGRGLSIWAFQPMTDGVVEGNTYDINVDQWQSGYTSDGHPGYGHFGVNKTRVADPTTSILQRWKFTKNQYVWRTYSTAASSIDACIMWSGIPGAALPTAPDTDIEFVDNTYENCPSSYFLNYHAAGMLRWRFDDKIHNLGSGLLGSTWQSMFYIRDMATFTDIHMGGRIDDDVSGATSQFDHILYCSNSGAETIPAFVRVDMHDLKVTSTATTPPILTNVFAGQVIDVRIRQDVYTAPTGYFAAGSEILERATGMLRKQTAQPSGNTWATVASNIPEVQAGTTNSLATSYDRRTASTSTTGIVSGLASGTCTATLVAVPKASKTVSVRFVTGTTAAVTPTNGWAALTDVAGNVIAVTADKTATAMAASTYFTWTWTAATVIPPGNYYVQLMVAAATVPTIMGVVISTGFTKFGPALSLVGPTGQTTPPAVGGVLALSATSNAGLLYIDLG